MAIVPAASVSQKPLEKRWISAVDFSAFRALSPPEAGFRENEWQSGARNHVPKNG
jgi:hypothetical protein